MAVSVAPQTTQIKPLAIIGIDGVTWDVIDPLIDEGVLPNIARMVATGTRATLIAPAPLLSPRIWTTIASGKTEDEHGVFGFYESGDDVKVPRLWDIAQSRGASAGVYNWPVTWPLPTTCEFIVPDMCARDDSTCPPELRFVQRLLNLGRRAARSEGKWAAVREAVRHGMEAVRFGVSLSTMAHCAWAAVAGRRHADIKAESAAALFHGEVLSCLVGRFSPTLLCACFNETDAAQHRFWRAPGSRGNERSAAGSDLVGEVYHAADRALGLVLWRLDQRYNILVVSDHGFGPATALSEHLWGQFRFGRLLSLLGLDGLVSVTRPSGTTAVLRPAARDADNGAESLEDVEKALRAVHVCGSHTPLLTLEVTRNEVRIRVALQAIREHSSAKLNVGGTIVPASELVDAVSRGTGEHRPNGIFLAAGPDVRRGCALNADASVLDVAPTALRLMGLPLPHDMRGRVLQGALTPELCREPVLHVDSYDAVVDKGGARGESAPLDEAVLARLRDLGYIE